MASSIMRPAVVDFLELSIPGRGAEVDLEEVRVIAGSPIVGKTIKSLEEQSPRLRIVALKREGQGISLIPDSGTAIAEGDYLVVIGERSGVKQLTEIVAP
jgi:voltage-gated potassium channel